ncbi:hypothetical protein N0B44_06195 [Roseibacterium beibuensis]|nr:hypothetical protein [Roseibacterium beibuensis]MCS6622495.1 hypothetical protein [Roseibacterium beibuensis]
MRLAEFILLREFCPALTNWSDMVLKNSFPPRCDLAVAKSATVMVCLEFGKPVLNGVEGVELGENQIALDTAAAFNTQVVRI